MVLVLVLVFMVAVVVAVMVVVGSWDFFVKSNLPSLFYRFPGGTQTRSATHDVKGSAVTGGYCYVSVTMST